MPTLYLYAQFTSQKSGISTLDDVTIDIDRVNKSTGSVSAFVTGAIVTSAGNLSPLRNGLYRYAIADPDVRTYDYLGTFKTQNSSVDLKHVPSLRQEYVDSLDVENGAVLIQTEQANEFASQSSVDALPSVSDMAAAVPIVVNPTPVNVTTETVDNAPILNKIAEVKEDTTAARAKLNVPGTLANTENAELFQADVTEVLAAIESSGLTPEQIAELLRAAGLIQTPINPTITTSLSAGEIFFRRGDTFTRTLELAASAAGYDKLWMTFKRDATQPDEKSSLQFIAGEGLKILNGTLATATGAPFTPDAGEITLAGDGVTLTINLDESVTAQLSSGNAGAKWDVQMLKDGAVTTIAEGTWKVVADVTRATE